MRQGDLGSGRRQRSLEADCKKKEPLGALRVALITVRVIARVTLVGGVPCVGNPVAVRV
jgi:hypothetical protein